jgi:integrase
MRRCPECGSNKVWKAGFRYVQGEPIQRYLCRECGFRFSDPEFSRKITNSSYGKQVSRQICVTETKVAKNLVRAKTKHKLALQENKNNTKSRLVNFSWHLKKLGRSESTIKTYTNYVKNMATLGELNDPEEIKGVIATHYKDKNSQRMACCAYDAYVKFKGRKWHNPHYKPEHKQVFIPTEEELRLAINTGHKESMVFSKFLYETGARSNEAHRLEWTDLDPERNNVTIKASKNGNSRTIEISKELMDLLFSLPKTENQKTVFIRKPRNTRSSSFHNRMKRLAKIHNNPRFEKIHFHTFRHCKALREYHKTRDILHVMVILGHRKIETTYRYVRLYHQIYKPQQPKQFITKITPTKEQRIELMNDGWTLVDKDEKEWYFRKPK